ncbi:MAG: hypothetical protein LBI69_02415 [Puniceicoccales bacterium]|jgi:DNA polymerase-1|nr:hypothetical protein [Puniceicoccales bacterium]
MDKEQLLLIDGHNLMFRAFYGIRDLSRSDGFPTNAIYGWVRAIGRLRAQIIPQKTFVFFDFGESRMRREIFPNYKAQRKPMPDELRQQISPIQEITSLMGIGIAMREGDEADDLLASFAVQQSKDQCTVAIASSDKDFGQIIGDSICQLYPPGAASGQYHWKLMDAAAIESKFGVPPSMIVDYLSLVGDAADNIRGIPGVGPKTAARWLREYLSIDNLLSCSQLPADMQNKLANHGDLLRLNQRLIALDLSLDSTAPSLEIFQPHLVRKFFEKFEMLSLIRECVPVGKNGELFANF